MLRTTFRILNLATTAALALSLNLTLQAPQRAAAKIQSVNSRACPGAVYASIEMDNIKDGPPGVGYVYGDQRGQLKVLSSRPQPSGQDTHIIYEYFGRTSSDLPSGATAWLTVDGAKAGQFTVSAECPVLGRVAGTAYLDKNANAKRDRGEPVFTAAWLKLTDGGSWFVCGWVGGDATYGITVNPGVYYVMPVAPKGYRTTTPRIKTEVLDLGHAALGNDMGFVADPRAPGDACDQYNPPRP